MNSRPKSGLNFWLGWLLAGLFFFYYAFLGNHLPLGSGPDFRAHNDITAFIAGHGRLARLPEDEGELYFTPYGGTRASRPPLSYLVSALIITLAGKDISNPEAPEFRIAARKGSALLVALAVMVLFQAFRLYCGSTPAGMLLAVIVGLMPQWAFIGSYNNDDSAALVAGALVLYSLIRLYRSRLTWSNAAWLGFAAGIAILSKPTAWLLLPMLALSTLLLARITVRDWFKKAALALLILILAGGWWPLWNMVHLGWNDPVQAKVVQRLATRHLRLNHDLTYSYSDKGVSATDLVLHNYNNFLTKTFVSTIGNLDWLRIRVGSLQYGCYGVLFLLGFIRLLLLTGTPKGQDTVAGRQRLFGLLLLLGLLTQLGGYLLVNLYNDIQEQGKYLLPALGLILLPLAPLLRKLHKALAAILCSWTSRYIRLSSNCHGQSLALLVAVILFVHLDALYTYIIPYYWPPSHRIQVRRMVPFTIRIQDIQARHDISRLALNNQQQLEITASGPDPWFILPSVYCKLLRGPNMLFRVRLQATQRGRFSLFWESKPGAGFTASAQVSARYTSGSSEFILGLTINDCHRLRVDPVNHSGSVQILDMAAVRIDIDWPVAP